MGDATRVEAEWKEISSAPPELDLEVAVIDREGPHALMFPCRRSGSQWLDARTGVSVSIRPTHWRTWERPNTH